ncbi:MAG: DUF6318 family protein, partial [Nocardioidaceae bacterium]
MRRAVVAFIALGLCALGLAACTDDTARTPTSTTSETSPTDPPSSSTPSTTEPTSPAPPELPDAAKEKTPAGAKAFIRFYVDVVNAAWKSQSSKQLRSLATRSCSVCV